MNIPVIDSSKVNQCEEYKHDVISRTAKNILRNWGRDSYITRDTVLHFLKLLDENLTKSDQISANGTVNISIDASKPITIEIRSAE